MSPMKQWHQATHNVMVTEGMILVIWLTIVSSFFTNTRLTMESSFSPSNGAVAMAASGSSSSQGVSISSTPYVMCLVSKLNSVIAIDKVLHQMA